MRRSPGLEIEANFHHLWLSIGLCQLQTGAAQKAVGNFRRVVELAPWWSDAAWLLAAAYHLAGESQEWVRKLVSAYSHTNGAASYYAAVGTRMRCSKRLTGRAGSDPGLREIRVDRVFDPYRADPRFQSLFRRMSLVDTVN